MARILLSELTFPTATQVRNRYTLPIADGRLIDYTAIIVTGRPIPTAVAAAAAAAAADPDAEATE